MFQHAPLCHPPWTGAYVAMIALSFLGVAAFALPQPGTQPRGWIENLQMQAGVSISFHE